MNKKVVLGILVVVVIAGSLYFYRDYQNTKQVQAAAAAEETVPVETGSLEVTISAIGQVRSLQSASLTWKTSGSVKNVQVKEGQTVEAGQVLAELEQTSLPQNVILAEADLASAQQAKEDLVKTAETSKVKAMQDIVTYEQAVKDAQYKLDNYTNPTSLDGMDAVEAVNQTKSILDSARAAFEPYKFSSSGNNVREGLREALDNAQSNYNSAVRRLQLEYDLEVAQTNLRQAHQDYEKWKNGPPEVDVQAADAKITATEATLKQAWLESPFAGTITKAEPLTGDQVAQGDLAFQIDNLETFYIDLNVSELDIQKVKAGQPATIIFDAMGSQTYHGEVEKVGLISTKADNSVDFSVTVRIDDADLNVHPGMTAEVEVMVVRKDNALLIPNQAIVTENGRQVVYVVKPGQEKQAVEVTLGAASDTSTELLEGDLKAGDEIVLNPMGASDTSLEAMFTPRQADDEPEGNGPQHPGGAPGGQP